LLVCAPLLTACGSGDQSRIAQTWRSFATQINKSIQQDRAFTRAQRQVTAQFQDEFSNTPTNAPPSPFSGHITVAELQQAVA
jgi:hypothetical protein